MARTIIQWCAQIKAGRPPVMHATSPLLSRTLESALARDISPDSTETMRALYIKCKSGDVLGSTDATGGPIRQQRVDARAVYRAIERAPWYNMCLAVQYLLLVFRPRMALGLCEAMDMWDVALGLAYVHHRSAAKDLITTRLSECISPTTGRDPQQGGAPSPDALVMAAMRTSELYALAQIVQVRLPDTAILAAADEATRWLRSIFSSCSGRAWPSVCARPWTCGMWPWD
eukprot:TRINITY_DN16461_c0_g1_i2.p1 TRINITY_DN16461_c0_g1~~TRINITY_DN16461_c0_g1_i2.p1  ORF type:complete len:230 (-),score=29.99 TRINITY_DN16461_c0_g1_i2:143-832(-)